MKRDTIMIAGRAYDWRAVLELRRAQLESRRAGQGRQLALFALHEDRRPVSQRTAAGRYEEPGLLELIADRKG